MLLRIRPIARVSAILFVGVMLAVFVLGVTLDRITARPKPQIALAWNPGSADANARAGRLLLEHMTAGMKEQIRSYGMRSLTRQPVNAAAPTLLAIVASLDGKNQQAERLVRYAETMSRRDVPTEMWLIEHNVQRGDIPNALVHYDRALRTNDQTREILFPILNQAVSDPEIARPMAMFLARRPVWGRPFMTQYIPVSTSPNALYTFARGLKLDRAPTPDPTMLQAIEKRLVDLYAYQQSAALYNRAHGLPADDRTPIRNGGFEQPGNWDPFDWNLIDDENLAGLRQPNPTAKGGTALFPFAANGRGGDVAVQLTLLPPGNYAITARVGGTRGDPLAFPQLVVRCARDGREVLHAAFPPSPDTGQSWRVGFTIPSNCTAQRIVVRAASGIDGQVTAPWIDDISIRPLGGR